MLNMITDTVFRPISGIKECVEKAKMWDALLVVAIVIAANCIPFRGNEKYIVRVIGLGIALYILSYGTLVTSGGMYLGKKMNFKNNYAFPYITLPFSFLSMIYLGNDFYHKKLFFTLFLFSWELLLEIIYVKYTFEKIKIIDSVLIVIYSYLMRIFMIIIFLISNKFYWLR